MIKNNQKDPILKEKTTNYKQKRKKNYRKRKNNVMIPMRCQRRYLIVETEEVLEVIKKMT